MFGDADEGEDDPDQDGAASFLDLDSDEVLAQILDRLSRGADLGAAYKGKVEPLDGDPHRRSGDSPGMPVAPVKPLSKPPRRVMVAPLALMLTASAKVRVWSRIVVVEPAGTAASAARSASESPTRLPTGPTSSAEVSSNGLPWPGLSSSTPMFC